LEQRIDLATTTPEGYRLVLALDRHVRAAVDPGLLALIELRASMVNGCAFCVDMHGTSASSSGEPVRRLLALAAWRESAFFDRRERAVLALTDAVTRLGEGGVPDDVWDAVVAELGEVPAGEVLLAVATINVWNRLAVTSRIPAPALEAA
jgi:AhpD family alkylhydroperoxidase